MVLFSFVQRCTLTHIGFIVFSIDVLHKTLVLLCVAWMSVSNKWFHNCFHTCTSTTNGIIICSIDVRQQKRIVCVWHGCKSKSIGFNVCSKYVNKKKNNGYTVCPIDVNKKALYFLHCFPAMWINKQWFYKVFHRCKSKKTLVLHVVHRCKSKSIGSI